MLLVPVDYAWKPGILAELPEAYLHAYRPEPYCFRGIAYSEQ